MIHCNLSVLLAEQNLKISSVSKATGISRTTLTALSSNASQGIQFETLNTLCMHLNVRPEQLISYFPANISVSNVSVTGNTVLLDLEIVENNICYAAKLNGLATRFQDRQTVVFDLIPYDTLNERTLKAIQLLRRLPRAFLKDFENLVIQKSLPHFTESTALSVIWNTTAV